MSQRMVIGEFEIDPAIRRLRRLGGVVVHLPNRPFQVLLHLVANRERLVPRTELLELFWDGRDVYEDALTRCVSSVRKALGDQDGATRYIETRWAGGYRFVGSCRELARPTIAPRDAAPLAERLVQRGNAYLGRSGNRSYRYALEMFRQASALDPEDARAHGGVSASHALLYLHAEPMEHHHAAAVLSMRKALDIDALCAEAQLSRALVGLMRADHAEADAAFRQAELLEPGLFHTWYYHARGCAERSDHDGALTYFTRATEANPLDYQALALAEQSFARMGLRADQRRAARACAAAAERALQRNPDDVRALSLAACVLPHLKRNAEAAGWTERAVALEPDEPFVNFNAACVYISLGDYDRAIHYFRRVPLNARGNYNWIAHDPCLDPVRTHPRFTALLPAPA
ncbi:MAG TPA: winged helix-turn-helix domain-containing protein [Steroidobacteraceae bacterium]|nr:winged helix-turn-helix domain-containing protein [Steroidobacteraceae bacterium]